MINANLPKLFSIVIIIALGIFASHAWIFANGYITTDADETYTIFISIDDSIKAGIFPPEWSANALSMSGEPINFFHPFVTYLVEIVHIFVPDIIKSANFTVPIILVSSGLTFFLLARRITGTNFVALISSVFYMYAPYRFTDSHIRGDFAESAAFIFMPLVVYFVLKATNKSRNNLGSLILGGISFGMLLISHVMIVYLFVLFIFIPLLLYKIFTSHNLSQVKSFVAIFGIGLGITAYFWIPFVLEINYVNFSGFALFSNVGGQIPWQTSILGQTWPLGPRPDYYMNVGYPAVAAMIMGLAFFKDRRILLISLSSWFYVFLMTSEGNQILNLIPLIADIQFPYRLLTVITLVTSVLLGLVIKALYTKLKPRLAILHYDRSFILLSCGLMITIIFIMAYTMTNIPPDSHVTNPTRDQICCSITATQYYYAPKTIPIPHQKTVILNNDTGFLVTLAPGKFGSFMIQQSKPFPMYNVTNSEPDNLNPSKNIEVNIKNTLIDWEIQTSSKYQNLVDFRIFYYPGWHVYLDGQRQQDRYDESNGHISVLVPAGDHHLRIVYEDTPPRFFG